jgi:competence protein ComEC
MRKSIIISIIFYMVFLFFLKSIGFWDVPRGHNKKLNVYVDKRISVIGIVDDFPVVNFGRLQFKIKTKYMNGKSANFYLRVDVKYNKNIKINFGDIIQVNGDLSLIDTKNIYMKRYIYDGIYFILKDSCINGYKSFGCGSVWRSFINKSRNFIIDRIILINKDQAQRFLPGLLLGDTSLFTKEEMLIFRRTGLTHVVAVSGMNIGIIVVIIFFLCTNKRSFIFYILVFSIPWFYAGMAAFTPSCLRATIICNLVMIGYMFKRDAEPIYMLFITAMIMLIFKATMLFTISFQFSFLATLGILMYYKFISSKLLFLPKFLREITAMTISAQVLLVPIMIIYFKQISTISVFANIIFVPFVGIMMCLSIGAFFVSLVWLKASIIISMINWFLLKYLMKFLIYISNYSWSMFYVEHLNIWIIILYYICLFVVTTLLIYKKEKKQYE